MDTANGWLIYDQRVNIRTASTTLAQTPTVAGDTWSIMNELTIPITDKTPGKFFSGSKISIAAMLLPMTYKNRSDGTTIVGIDYSNDGVLPLEGVDVYLYNETIDDGPILAASSGDVIQPGGDGTVSFEMQLPELSAFTTDMQYHLLVVPAGTADVTAETMTAQSDDTISFALGNPHLTLEADYYLIDGQESVVATVKNEGAVTSQPASNARVVPRTGDTQLPWQMTLVLFALIATSVAVAVRIARKSHDG